ncbi:MAG: DUF4124 domain-containing protein [Chromatiales bacterium]|jgi:hypothetical protein
MKIAWLVLALLVPPAAGAEIYRIVDEDGNVVYSDTPAPSAERVRLPGLSTYAPPEYKTAGEEPAGAEAESAAAAEYAVSIVRPEPDASVRADGGTLDVELDVSPPPGGSGDVVMYRLDDEAPRSTTRTTFSLEDVSRGPHTLTVWIADSGGNPLSDRRSVRFGLLRGSDLFHPPSEGLAPGVQQAPRAPMAPRAPRPDIPRQYAPTPPPAGQGQ